MWRLLEPEITSVIDGGQTLVGALRVVNAVIALAARHQWRDHHLRSHLQRLAHEVFCKFRADLDQHPANLVTEREWPRQWFRPVALQNVQIGAANTAGADLDESGLARNFRPRHGADDRPCSRAIVGAYANLLHALPLAPFFFLDGAAKRYSRRIAMPTPRAAFTESRR